jgi:hypothetical protein
MKIRDLFKRSINRPIKGVVTIGNEEEAQRKQELEEYVVTKELINHFRTFFKSYRASVNQPTDRMGVWITGFFGSGKSHFLKILSYILENREVDGKKAIEYFDDRIGDEFIKADIKASASIKNTVVLFNIDSKSKSDSKFNKSAIMDVMLRSFNEKIGLCATVPWVADFERDLMARGLYEHFTTTFEEISNMPWKKGRNRPLLERDAILNALVKVKGISQESAKKHFDDQQLNHYIDTEIFAKLIDEYCVKNNTHVVFLVDEVGQYIGENSELMLNLQTVVEDLGKFCKGKAWVVVTSQQGLDVVLDNSKMKIRDFSKIQGRFATRMLLSGSNADEVIKRRILEKNENAETPLKSIYEVEKSRLNNLILFQLAPKWNGFKDAEEFKDVYPFVPYQFDLLQKVFEAIREHGLSEGKHLSQSERSLLSAFQESAQKQQETEVGILIPFNSFYATIEQFIDYNIKLIFTSATKRSTLSDFSLEVLKVLFMIKHVKEMPSTLDRLTTLMVSNINEDKLILKNKIDEALKQLEAETLVQKNGEEYDFLTNEEQDINRQINGMPINESEVIRRVGDAVYDRVLESNKFKYKNRYDFALNRYVDYDLRGNVNSDAVNIKIITVYSSIEDDSQLATESTRTNSIIVDLRKGLFIDELIRVSKIETFKRNNAVGRGASFVEIMSKKDREVAERRSRAEDLIKQELRSANIYFNGQLLDIKLKDSKDRLFESIENAVQSIYYKLDYVKDFTTDSNSIREILRGRDQGFALEVEDVNQSALNELIEHVNSGKSYHRTVTVKSMIIHFMKAPYGWKEFDIRAMIAKLWYEGIFKILIHNSMVSKTDNNFINDFVKSDNEDTMVVLPQEKIDIQVLGNVRNIMKRAFNQNFSVDEETLKEEVIHFLNSKKQILHDINVKNGSRYPGRNVLRDIHSKFERLSKIIDNSTLFNDIIILEDEFLNDGEMLDVLEAFYSEGSALIRNYQDSEKLCKWYDDNRLLEDLSEMDEVIEKTFKITGLENPFDQMSNLSSLVFKGNQIKDAILTKKVETAISKLKNNLETIKREYDESKKLEITEAGELEINNFYEEVTNIHNQWLGTLNLTTNNVDSYVASSNNFVSKFRTKILEVINKSQKIEEKDDKKVTRSKKVNISSAISVANRKIKSKEDIEKVLKEIREKLMRELTEVDYIEIE